MGMILRIASSRIVGQGDIVGRSGYFSLNLSANSVMRGRLDARRTLKSLVADLRKYKIMEVLLNLQNKNVTLNAVHVAPEGTNCCNRLKVHFDVFQETAKKAAIIRLSTANSFELIHYQDKHIALLIPFDRIQKISY